MTNEFGHRDNSETFFLLKTWDVHGVFSIQLTVNTKIPIIGFEPWISTAGCDRSTHCATSATLRQIFVCFVRSKSAVNEKKFFQRNCVTFDILPKLFLFPFSRLTSDKKMKRWSEAAV